MKTFSQGSLCTPRLLKINYGRRWNHTKYQWEKMEVEIEGNDLNKAIQRSYEKQNQDISLDLKLLTLKDDNSMEICYNEHPTSFYQNLTHLILWKCENIKYAFPSSIAKSLHQLQQLKIQNCKVLEEIVAKEEEGANAVVKFIFPNVNLLKLEGLPKLAAFYPEMHTSEWPKLKELVVRNCDKFTSKCLSFRENNEESELNILDPKSIFLEYKVLTVDICAETMVRDDIRRGHLWLSTKETTTGTHALELSMLKTLQIDNCRNFTSICQDFQDNNKEGEVQVSESKSICLEHKINSDLEEITLEDYWEGDVREINWLSESKTLCISNANISVGLLQRFYNLEVLFVDSNDRSMSLLSFSAYFQNLKVLEIRHCSGLIRRLITPSMTKSLVQLREMSIDNCELLTEIVENEGDETTTEIVFNNLNKLSLQYLNCLTCFSSGNYSFNFPSLEELIIKDCPNMKTFSSRSLSTPKLCSVHFRMFCEDEMKLSEIGENDLNTIIQEASNKKVNTDLRKLTLNGRDIMSIWKGEFEENFVKVETLELIKDEYAYIPIQILLKFVSLEILILEVSSYEEIFSCGEGEEHVRALAKLKVLLLCGLFNLKCIWKRDFQFKSILQNLHSLLVVYCHNLMTVLPPSSSFENLTTLEVWFCNGVQNLIASSTAKSLVCLEKLKIRECEMMIEVLANEEDVEEDEIVFQKLKKLTLFKLESLTCFYSGNYSLNFPFLESLNVSKCFKMKTFSRESLKMPRLQKVNGKVCINDLNSVIQQLQNDCSKFCDRITKELEEELEEGLEEKWKSCGPLYSLSHALFLKYEAKNRKFTASMEDEEESSNV